MRRTCLYSILILLAACGGTSEPAPPLPAPSPAPATTPPPTAPLPPGPPAKPDAEGIVRLTANDQMRFSTNRIEVPAGKVKIELKNAGTLPKTAMGHNLTVLRPGSDAMAFGMKAVTAVATEYMPPGAPEVLGHTKLLGPGESAILDLELVAGTYPFLCTFPGHVGLMRGELVAQ